MGVPWPSDPVARRRWYDRPAAQRAPGPVVLVREELAPDSRAIPAAPARTFAVWLRATGRDVRVLHTVAATPGGGAPASNVSVQARGIVAYWSLHYSAARWRAPRWSLRRGGKYRPAAWIEQSWAWKPDYALVASGGRPVKLNITRLRQLIIAHDGGNSGSASR